MPSKAQILAASKTKVREYRTEAGFLRALRAAIADGSLVEWYGTDHTWALVVRS